MKNYSILYESGLAGLAKWDFIVAKIGETRTQCLIGNRVRTDGTLSSFHMI